MIVLLIIGPTVCFTVLWFSNLGFFLPIVIGICVALLLNYSMIAKMTGEIILIWNRRRLITALTETFTTVLIFSVFFAIYGFSVLSTPGD